MDEIMVSVLCTVYNHEKYLRRCLEGVVSQKTNFKFEFIINDDFSKDSSPEILKEYAAKYPDIIKLVLQKENQYSKGVSISNEILFPLSRGKYIALCEGDDYWSDNNKLQSQFDYMETHKKNVMCVHNTVMHDLLKNKKQDSLFNNWHNERILSDEDIFWGWNVHTSSYFIRREFFIVPKQFKKYWFGDYVRLTYGQISGSIGYIPAVMSVYNYNNINGCMKQIERSTIDERVQRILERAEYLKELDQYSCFKYTKIINERIKDIEFDSMLLMKSYLIYNAKDNKEAVSYAKEIHTDSRFIKRYKKASFLNKIKLTIKYKGYWVYPLWKFIWNKYISIN